MVDIASARQIALSLPGTTEHDHFGRPAFKANGRIFSTLWINEGMMMVKLNPVDQSVFHTFDPAIFYPVPNKWGLGGATLVALDKVREDMLRDALDIAWGDVMKLKKKR